MYPAFEYLFSFIGVALFYSIPLFNFYRSVDVFYMVGRTATRDKNQGNIINNLMISPYRVVFALLSGIRVFFIKCLKKNRLKKLLNGLK